jgi:tripartite-type tricarboxylate transporter receptor subunit TctC
MIGKAPYALAVYREMPAKNVSELIALAKSRTDLLTYSTVGPASLAHLAGELFSSMTGAKLTAVPYGSASQAVFDVYKGVVDMQFGAAGASLPLIRDGSLRALAVTSAHRTPALPDVPTLAESGLPGYDAALWMAIVMPANVPEAIVARLNKETNRAIADPEVRALLAAQALDPEASSPAELRAKIAGDITKWRAVATGVKAP